MIPGNGSGELLVEYDRWDFEKANSEFQTKCQSQNFQTGDSDLNLRPVNFKPNFQIQISNFQFQKRCEGLSRNSNPEIQTGPQASHSFEISDRVTYQI